MQITFKSNTSDIQNDRVAIIPVFEDKTAGSLLPDTLRDLVEKAAGLESKFGGKKGETFLVSDVSSGKRVMLLGLGKKDTAGDGIDSSRALGISLYQALSAEKITAADIYAANISMENGPDNHIVVAEMANAMLLASYEFKKYKTTAKPTPEMKVEIRALSKKKAQNAFAPLKSTTESSFWASDLAHEPPNVLNPETYANRIKAELEPLGVKIRIIGADEMKQLGMGAACAVGQGSVTPPRMVVMEYDGTNGADGQPLGLVGKGITFDTGGISIKPSANMGDMKYDMGGSAAVVGAMRAAAARKAKAKIVAIVGLAENMPSGNAYRPGDIVKSMSGLTIDVGNTDAEGRLVLCDALTYIQKYHNPHTIVDCATLTGTQVVALGKEFAAIYSNDDSLRGKFNTASARSGEKTWPMPLMETKKFDEAVKKTPDADLSNIADGPGSCTAAAFLHAFIAKDENDKDKCLWTHVDMAGPGIGEASNPKKGWGVLLLNELIKNYEVDAEPANTNDATPTQKVVNSPENKA